MSKTIGWGRRLKVAANAEGLVGHAGAVLRFRLLHIPGRLVHHARDAILRIPADWPWAQAFTTCWNRLAELPHPG